MRETVVGGEAGEGEKSLLLHYKGQSWWIPKPLNKELGAVSDWKKQMGDQPPCLQRHPETVAQSQSEYPPHRLLCPCSKDGDTVTCGCCPGLRRSS